MIPQSGKLPSDLPDKYRDEDETERRRKSRRRYRIGGRRKTDNKHLKRPGSKEDRNARTS